MWHSSKGWNMWSICLSIKRGFSSPQQCATLHVSFSKAVTWTHCVLRTLWLLCIQKRAPGLPDAEPGSVRNWTSFFFLHIKLQLVGFQFQNILKVLFYFVLFFGLIGDENLTQELPWNTDFLAEISCFLQDLGGMVTMKDNISERGEAGEDSAWPTDWQT